MSDIPQMHVMELVDNGVVTPVDLAARDNNPYGTPKTADAALSLAVMEASPPTPQACWRNSILAYWAADTAVRKERAAAARAGDDSAADDEVRLFYVEGQLIMPLKGGGRFSIEHAWLETEEGRVIETTLRDVTAEDGWAYFTGARMTLEDVLNLLRRNHNTLPLTPLLDRWMPAEAEAYRTAMRAAYWHAWGIDVFTLHGQAI